MKITTSVTLASLLQNLRMFQLKKAQICKKEFHKLPKSYNLFRQPRKNAPLIDGFHDSRSLFLIYNLQDGS